MINQSFSRFSKRPNGNELGIIHNGSPKDDYLSSSLFRRLKQSKTTSTTIPRCSLGRLLEVVHRYSLTTLSLNEIFVGGGRIELRRSLEETKHRATKGRGDGEIDQKVGGRIACDAEISDFSDRSSTIRFIDVTNIQNQRKKSIGQITTDETTDNDD